MTNVTQKTIATIVIRVIAANANVAAKDVKESDNLRTKLLLNENVIKGLADTLSKVTQSYGGKKITIKEIQKCKTVGAVISLTFVKANAPPAKKKSKTKKKIIRRKTRAKKITGKSTKPTKKKKARAKKVAKKSTRTKKKLRKRTVRNRRTRT